MAACDDAAMSATCCSESGAFASTYWRTEVLRPEKLKSNPPLSSIARGKAIALASPFSATRCTMGPPGNPSPRSFAILSKASPAASSRVLPISS